MLLQLLGLLITYFLLVVQMTQPIATGRQCSVHFDNSTSFFAAWQNMTTATCSWHSYASKVLIVGPTATAIATNSSCKSDRRWIIYVTSIEGGRGDEVMWVLGAVDNSRIPFSHSCNAEYQQLFRNWQQALHENHLDFTSSYPSLFNTWTRHSQLVGTTCSLLHSYISNNLTSWTFSGRLGHAAWKHFFLIWR